MSVQIGSENGTGGGHAGRPPYAVHEDFRNLFYYISLIFFNSIFILTLDDSLPRGIGYVDYPRELGCGANNGKNHIKPGGAGGGSVDINVITVLSFLIIDII